MARKTYVPKWAGKKVGHILINSYEGGQRIETSDNLKPEHLYAAACALTDTLAQQTGSDIVAVLSSMLQTIREQRAKARIEAGPADPEAITAAAKIINLQGGKPQ